MQILVTGGAGFIGSNLVDVLLQDGYRVRVIDNLSTGKLENLPLHHANLEFINGDITDKALIDDVALGVDKIVHLAAIASVQASVDDPIATHRANFDGTLNLLAAAQNHGINKFIYASSAAVYGDVKTLPVPESAALAPLTPYAADKLAGEYYLDFYVRQFGLNALAFRFFNIYGPRQDPSSPYSGVISIFTERAKKGLPITIFGDGEQTRDFVFIGDLVKVLVKGLEFPVSGFHVMNVGNGSGTSLLEMVSTIESIVGHEIEKKFANARPGDIRHSRANIDRLRELLGTAPVTPLRKGLEALIASLR
ncbi:MAG: NAD-dependent epimerase/dehydratase family protein [Pseudomonadota bacterium]